MLEPFEEQREASALCTSLKPCGKLAGVFRRQLGIFLVPRQIDDSLRTNAAVEVIVKKNFGNRAKKTFGQLHGGERICWWKAFSIMYE